MTPVAPRLVREWRLNSERPRAVETRTVLPPPIGTAHPRRPAWARIPEHSLASGRRPGRTEFPVGALRAGRRPVLATQFTEIGVAECLSILFEDAHCLAVVKAAGQFTQGTWAPPGETTLESDVRAYLGPASPAAVYLGIAHRLDRGTSGVLIWAKTKKAARRLSEELERRLVIKEYWAVVEGPPSTLPPDASPSDRDLLSQSGAEVVWSDWLTAANKAGVVTALDAPAIGARAAVTRVRYERAVALPEGCHWLRLWPETGRTHQLRASAAHRGMPVLGDAAYGSARSFPQPHAFALHARSLRLKHPISGAPLELIAPLPPAWAQARIVLT